MSKLEQLIQELCPNGVEYKSLGEICEVKGRIGFRGYKREDQVERGYGAISLSPSNITEIGINYTNCTYINWDKYEESPEIKVNNGDIIFCKTASVGKTSIVSNLQEKATINPQLILIKNIRCNPKFLHYFLKTNEFQTKVYKIKGLGTIPTISQADFVKLTVPVPPIEVQEEIVRILDNFTELTARKKQYEYYREKLLNEAKSKASKFMKFGDIATIVRGASPRPISTFITDNEDGVNWIKIGDVQPDSKYITTTKEKITLDGAKKSRMVNIGDFILSNSMSFGRPYIMKIQGCIHDGWLAISNFEKYFQSDFLYYLLNSNAIQHEMEQKASNGTVKNLNAEIVRNIELPIPPLLEQGRIVDILDRFDKLCNDISVGLPAEIEARKKQYEYYRDKLLTFKEKTI